MIYYKTSKNLIRISKTIRKGGKVDSNNYLYSDTKKCTFFERKKCKSKKTSTCFQRLCKYL